MQRKIGAAIAGCVLIAVLISAPAAQATPIVGHGESVTPAQPYLQNPNVSDWIGSYDLDGAQVWPTDFALAPPDSSGGFTSGQPLVTKWGTQVDPTIAAEIAYLTLRYRDSTDDAAVAAVSQLIYSWLSAPTNPSQLSPTNDFRHIAYDANYHLGKLSPTAQSDVASFRDDAAAHRGPWTVDVTAPDTQIVGLPGTWTVSLTATTTGSAVPGYPVTLTASDATLPNGSSSQTLDTPSDGSPLGVAVTPTGPNPSLTATVLAPPGTPTQLTAVPPDMTSVVAGSGADINASAQTTALTCTSVVRGTSGSLTVTQGSTCLVHAIVAGGVTVSRGATLNIADSSVRGSITSNGAAALSICGSTIGSVTVVGTSGAVLIGDPSTGCNGNTIQGGLVATGNSGGGTISDNLITGAWTISGNTPPITTTGDHH